MHTEHLSATGLTKNRGCSPNKVILCDMWRRVTSVRISTTVLTALCVTAAVSGQSYEAKKSIAGTVCDSTGTPIADSLVGFYWAYSDISLSPLTDLSGNVPGRNEYEYQLVPKVSTKSDRHGKFKLDSKLEQLPTVLMAIDTTNALGGHVLIPDNYDGSEITLTLRSMGRVTLELDLTELDGADSLININIFTGEQRRNLGYICAQCVQKHRMMSVSCALPIGEYEILAKTDSSNLALVPVILADSSSPSVVKSIRLSKDKLAYLSGKIPPRIVAAAVVGGGPVIDLDKYRGRWVIVEFWAYWCGPCVGIALPELAKFHRRNQDIESEFVILSIHSSRDVTTEKEYRKKVDSIKRELWHGSELPYPVIIDRSGQTARDWGVETFPRLVIIDPNGKVTALKTLNSVQNAIRHSARAKNEK